MSRVSFIESRGLFVFTFAFSTTPVLGLLHEHVAPVRRRTVVVALAFDESVLEMESENRTAQIRFSPIVNSLSRWAYI
jgi:hypothetical protein